MVQLVALLLIITAGVWLGMSLYSRHPLDVDAVQRRARGVKDALATDQKKGGDTDTP